MKDFNEDVASKQQGKGGCALRASVRDANDKEAEPADLNLGFSGGQGASSGLTTGYWLAASP